MSASKQRALSQASRQSLYMYTNAPLWTDSIHARKRSTLLTATNLSDTQNFSASQVETAGSLTVVSKPPSARGHNLSVERVSVDLGW